MIYIKKILPQGIKNWLGHIVCRIEEISKTNYLYMLIMSLFKKKREYFYSDKKKVVLVNTPIHPNLGDQAIAIAEEKFIKDNYPEYEYVELNDYVLFKEMLQLKKIIEKDDIIFCHGGGNMGTDYFWCEKARRTIIKHFPHNKIVVFPQTAYYKEGNREKKELEKTIKIFSSHNKVLLCAREQDTYNFMKKYFPMCNVVLVPDIVLYLSTSLNRKRSGALMCFRDDREKSISFETITQIDKALKDLGISVTYSDTVIKGYVYETERIKAVVSKLKEFAESELVITDRLHGMIFSYITNTPCIVYGNYNHKVEGMYNWFKNANCSTVCFLETSYEVVDVCHKMLGNNETNDNGWALEKYSQILAFTGSCSDGSLRCALLEE